MEDDGARQGPERAKTDDDMGSDSRWHRLEMGHGKRISLTDVVSSRSHGLENLIRESAAMNMPEGSHESVRDGRTAGSGALLLVKRFLRFQLRQNTGPTSSQSKAQVGCPIHTSVPSECAALSSFAACSLVRRAPLQVACPDS